MLLTNSGSNGLLVSVRDNNKNNINNNSYFIDENYIRNNNDQYIVIMVIIKSREQLAELNVNGEEVKSKKETKTR